jgi:hypothetical protein
VDNIKMEVGEKGCSCMNWIGLDQDRDKWSALMPLWAPLNTGKFLSGYTTGSLSCSAQLLRVSYRHTVIKSICF